MSTTDASSEAKREFQEIAQSKSHLCMRTDEVSAAKKEFQEIKEKGHICMRLVGYKVEWCQQNPCVNAKIVFKSDISCIDKLDERDFSQAMILRSQQMREFRQSLLDKDHTCIGVNEGFPVTYTWCHQTPCINQQTDSQ